MTSDEQAIRATLTEWWRATAAGDVNAIRPLLAEDVTFLTPGEAPVCGRDLFIDGLKAALRRTRFEPVGDIQEVAASGDMAYCRSRVTLTVTPKEGHAVYRTGSTLTVLRKDAAGSWLIARDANMLATADVD